MEDMSTQKECCNLGYPRPNSFLYLPRGHILPHERSLTESYQWTWTFEAILSCNGNAAVFTLLALKVPWNSGFSKLPKTTWLVGCFLGPGTHIAPGLARRPRQAGQALGSRRPAFSVVTTGSRLPCFTL